MKADTGQQQRKAKDRARLRLRALGIEVESMEREQVRTAWEASRAAYINIASAGQHMSPVHADGDPLSGACVHARFGMLHQALADYFGSWPDGWSAPHIAWPHHGHQPTPTVNVVQDQPPALREIAPGPITTLGPR